MSTQSETCPAIMRLRAEGLTYVQISRQLGISVYAVTSALKSVGAVRHGCAGRIPKRYLYRGEMLTLVELAGLTGIPAPRLQQRIARLGSADAAIRQPYTERRNKTEGETRL